MKELCLLTLLYVVETFYTLVQKVTYLMVISLAMVTSLAKRDHPATPQSQHFKNEKCL